MVVASFRESADPTLDDSEDDADGEGEGGGGVDEGAEEEAEAEDEAYSTASEASVGGGGGRGSGRKALSLGDRADALASGALQQQQQQRTRLGSAAAEAGSAEARRASRRALHRLYRRVTLRAVLIDLGFAAVAPLPCLLGGPPAPTAPTAAAAGDPAGGAGQPPPPPLPPLAWHTTLFGTRYAAAPEVWRAADAASAASLAARAAAGSGSSSSAGGGAPPPPPAAPTGAYTRAIDAWGLGVIAYYVLTGAPPFEEGPAGAAELKADILAGAFSRGGGVSSVSRPRSGGTAAPAGAAALRPVPWGVLHPGARALIEGLLVVEPARRWTPAEALAHPWTLQMQHLPPPFVR